ncbi:MAG: YifB family Mg chelatase-like AAA ATPase [Lachnospiraceae bacterium]
MIGQVMSAAVLDIDGYLVKVEADLCSGLPSFDMVGFLASEVREARERVRTALRNSGYMIPTGRLTVNLSPANLRKQGNYFDLPIAISILVAAGFLVADYVKDVLLIGELSLDGTIRPIWGTLSLVSTAQREGVKMAVVPSENAREGAVVEGIAVYGMKSLQEVVSFLNDKEGWQPMEGEKFVTEMHSPEEVDFADMNGQQMVKRATEIAAAGMHNILYIGPPGSGKTMAARRLPTILPELTLEESIEISKVYSICGLLPSEKGLIRHRPFRSPHHTISAQALTGGGHVPHPGEISLANRGVLFLDELPEFKKSTLEVLRQPMEDKKVVISRVQGSYVYPCHTLVCCAMNPCRCGNYPDRSKCRCTSAQISAYLGQISQPLLDRIDICVEAPRVPYEDVIRHQKNETSAQIRERVCRAAQIQKKRYRDEKILFNAQLSGSMVQKYCSLGEKEENLIKSVFEHMELSARAYHKILKVARTIADLEGAEHISTEHLCEAIHYRSLDKKIWGV